MKKASIILLLVLAACSNDHGVTGYVEYGGQKMPAAAPNCDPIINPLEWEPITCAEDYDVVQCYWQEQILFEEEVMSVCQQTWAFNKWECEWNMILTRCDSV